jgi:putative oxidoreductase
MGKGRGKGGTPEEIPMKKLIATQDSWTPTWLRVVLGAVMFPHGAQKLLGWFGGYGFDGTMRFLTGHVHLPYAIALLVVLAESLGALALITGAFTRVAAAGILSVMIGAVVTTHLSNGFFMNWSGHAAGEGFEYHLLALAIGGVVLALGGGKLSVDAWLAKRLGSARETRAAMANREAATA